MSAASSPRSATTPDLGTLPQWRLEDLYPAPDGPAYRADLDRALADSQAFEARWKGRLEGLLAERPADLAEAIAGYERLDELMGRIMSYAGLRFYADTGDADAARALSDARDRVTEASAHLLFFALELNRLDEAALQAAMAAEPALAHWKPWLDDLRKDRPHQLDDALEKLFHEKDGTGAAAWVRLYDETLAGLTFEVEGETLGLERALDRLQDADRDRRAAAAGAISETLSRHLRLFALVTNTLARDKAIADRWRGFTDVAAARHLANRVEPEVVDALVTAVRQAYPSLSHRYYAMKARWLGLERMRYYDRNAPLPAAPEQVWRWENAREAVLSAYDGFSPEMAGIAGRFFEEGWIDAPVRPAKRSGAFSHPTVVTAHPYIMLNYLGRPRDVMILAHELGHGVHQVLAAGQGQLMSSTPLTLAETASVFGEMLTFRSLLAAAPDAASRRGLLARKVEDMLNTVVRQIAFHDFERRVHEARRQGELAPETIGQHWMAVAEESLGPAFDLTGDYAAWWAYVPHFIHSPFYVYAYAFGDCLVNSLYAVYEEGHPGFAARYLDLLRAGGTKPHGELLAPFGLDAADPAFWSRGLAMIGGLIDELEGLEGAA